ncbi:glycosyltransferase family 9 protein [Mycobacterium sp. ITM-2016-00317]|uniref:glycosyltransferase family 9 protein n=1 Tax=Mycobacterium sp. ITM-2016-00317 TaxID=2099694 RepID=UPI000D4B2955|nr:glycosyltransferase family 9 protein [Mycobacterium sp. ITM-2016-00317]WNG90123.1 glycosyltransferase family 9 protein [Mycobacterium sp. ITM-2016-00317]
MALAADDGEPRTIVVLRALGLGDLLTAVPALRGLRRRYPDARITLAAPERYRELALHTGAVDEVVDTPALGPVRGVAERPDLAVNLHGRGPESIAALLALRPRMLFTHRHDDFPQTAGPQWQADKHEVDRWCQMLHWAGIVCRADDLHIERPPGYPDHSDTVVIHPGAGAPARQWPVQRFAEVAAALAGQGVPVVITGSPAEAELVKEVRSAAGLPESAIWPVTSDLLALVALIADCRLLICGDTGVGHIATATGTPSVLLFGPTPPQHWGPRGHGCHVTLWAGDRGDPHADTPDAGLLLLTAPRVLSAARDVLAQCP